MPFFSKPNSKPKILYNRLDGSKTSVFKDVLKDMHSNSEFRHGYKQDLTNALDNIKQMESNCDKATDPKVCKKTIHGIGHDVQKNLKLVERLDQPQKESKLKHFFTQHRK